MTNVILNSRKNFIGQLWGPKNGQFWAVLAYLASHVPHYHFDCSDNGSKARILVKVKISTIGASKKIQDGRLAAILNVKNG